MEQLGPRRPARRATTAPQDGIAELTTGLRCTPPGGRLRVSLTIRRRAGQPRAHVRTVVFFVKHGPRRPKLHHKTVSRRFVMCG